MFQQLTLIEKEERTSEIFTYNEIQKWNLHTISQSHAQQHTLEDGLTIEWQFGKHYFSNMQIVNLHTKRKGEDDILTYNSFQQTTSFTKRHNAHEYKKNISSSTPHKWFRDNLLGYRLAHMIGT